MTTEAPPPDNLLTPRHWLSWLGVGALWLTSRLPYHTQLAIGRALGKIFHAVAGRRRHIAETNLQLCFPQWSDAQRANLTHQHFEAVGIMLIEAGLSWWSNKETLRPLVRVEGMEHVEQALAKGKGVLLLSAHFTANELAGHLFAAGIPYTLHGMYRPHENPVVEHIFRTRRTRFMPQLIARQDTRSVLRLLKKNQLVWYAPDQAYRGKGSLMVPFFGVSAATNTATSRLARISGAAVVPFFPRRLPDDSGYVLSFLPALEDFPGEDEEENALRVNHVFEQMILQAPEQYFWLHRRFKQRGQDIYHESSL